MVLGHEDPLPAAPCLPPRAHAVVAAAGPGPSSSVGVGAEAEAAAAAEAMAEAQAAAGPSSVHEGAEMEAADGEAEAMAEVQAEAALPPYPKFVNNCLKGDNKYACRPNPTTLTLARA